MNTLVINNVLQERKMLFIRELDKIFGIWIICGIIHTSEGKFTCQI